jgi:Mannosylglycerate hydrolase MGH1-like glycoside hydrolase domain
VSRELSDFTPFGYLRNTAHHARSWGDTSGGNLRTSLDRLGVEWVYPVGRDAASHAGIVLETVVHGRACRTRADFDAIGGRCTYHSCLTITYSWQLGEVHVEADFFLVGDDGLAVRVTAHNTGSNSRPLNLQIVPDIDGNPPHEHVLIGATAMEASLAPGERRQTTAILTRAAAEAEPLDAERAFGRLREEDRRFFATCPTLSGDWPAHWPEGLQHDLQTTRLLVQPAGGIFTDVWPAWMAAWPRVVFAEGTLDMLRLAYADPALAKRAVASLLRDAPEPNVPCVFRDGEYNMVARDGSRCGTSPAWCLPFLNLELLYLRTLDREWLAEIYPGAAAYLTWWLEHRTDADGWFVYKCTWESGEDGNPRLDPTGSGDADIASRVRPVELQATVAHAAGVLAFFAEELGRDPSDWRHVEADYRQRTSQLFDPTERRYLDWLIAENHPQRDCRDQPYWGIDTCRYSAQSLTPLLVGLPLDREEIWRHATPPWTLWPSWTWSLVESAAAAGDYAGVGRLADETVDRVYRITTRRELGSLRRPLPGCSPEFWPEDWRTYGGSDAYGWGATTTNLLIRHLFGFKESRDTSGWVFDLTPGLPPRFLRPGARYTVNRLNYRGRTFDLSFTVLDTSGRVRATLTLYDASPREFNARVGERLIVRA